MERVRHYFNTSVKAHEEEAVAGVVVDKAERKRRALLRKERRQRLKDNPHGKVFRGSRIRTSMAGKVAGGIWKYLACVASCGKTRHASDSAGDPSARGPGDEGRRGSETSLDSYLKQGMQGMGDALGGAADAARRASTAGLERAKRDSKSLLDGAAGSAAASVAAAFGFASADDGATKLPCKSFGRRRTLDGNRRAARPGGRFSRDGVAAAPRGATRRGRPNGRRSTAFD